MALTGGTRRAGEAKVALVVGATGLVGTELVRALISLCESDSESWKLVCGVARKPPEDDEVVDNNNVDGGARRRDDKYRFVECDLLDRVQTQERLGPLAEKVTHVFWVTWASQFGLDTPECCDQNRAMLSNALDALLLQKTPHALCHLSLQTGTKHYVSLKALASTSSAPLYDEESPRSGPIDGESHNFYYAVEDAVKERVEDHNGGGGGGGCNNDDITITWSVHRPGLLLGASRRSYFNVVGSLCVYGSICKYLGLPFLFCGSRRCWEEPYIDASDVRLVAHQHIWWATEASHGHRNGQAFNAVDGNPFTWKEIWPALAAKLGLQPLAAAAAAAAVTSEEVSYSRIMEDKGEVWDEMVKREGLQPTRMEEMANWAFLDALFCFPGKLLASPAKARRLGFTSTTDAVLPDSFLYWVDRMRAQRLIPELAT